MSKQVIGIGMMGLGTVGSGVWTILKNRRHELEVETGCTLEIKRILVRDLSKDRGIPEAVPLLTDSFEDMLADDNIQIIVDAMGGENPALSYVQTALMHGYHAVTANKEVMAKHGSLIHRIAAEQDLCVYTEACVGGGIPILHPLQECFAANCIESVSGIINGTTNYILTSMAEAGKGFDEVLAEAQELGYAEADPAADVEGLDAVYKTVILAREAFGIQISWEQVFCEGITAIEAFDVHIAQEWGYVIKLIGSVRRNANGIQASVRPNLVPKDHILAAVRGVNNGILVKGDHVGNVLFAGPGAGALATGSAMVSDIVRVVHQLQTDKRIKSTAVKETSLSDADEGDYYLRWFSSKDLSEEVVEGLKALNKVELQKVQIRPWGNQGKVVSLVLVKHAKDDDIANMRRIISNLAGPSADSFAIRIEADL